MSSGPSLSGEAALAAHFSALDLSPGGLLSVVLSVTLALAVTVTLTLEIKARLDKARRERAFKALFRAVAAPHSAPCYQASGPITRGDFDTPSRKFRLTGTANRALR